MEQDWFYAEGEASVGPLSSDALIRALRPMREPGKVLVWRAGLDSWQHAADVPEVAARLAKPVADMIVALDPALDRWTNASQEALDDEDDPGSKRRWPHVAVAVALAVAIIGGATYASRVFGPAGDEARALLPREATRSQPASARPDPAVLLAQLTERATQASAATDAIAAKLWASIEPETMQSKPDFATASRSELEAYLGDLKTAEANAAAAGPQYAALLDAERGLIEEAARSSRLDDSSRSDLLAAVGERHSKSLDQAGRMLQARQDLYRAMQAAQTMLIGEFGKYKVDADGHVHFSNKTVADRAAAANQRINAARDALDRIQLEITRSKQISRWAPEPAWRDMMIKEWSGTP